MLKKSTNRHVISFDGTISQEDLVDPVGEGLAGTTSIVIEEDEQVVVVRPKPIPILICSIWMYLVWAAMGIGMAFADLGRDNSFWAVWILAAIFVIPPMMALLYLHNQQVGTRPYLIFDKRENTISLPRIPVTFQKHEVEKLVFVDRFIESGRHFQLALLAKTDEKWHYAHVYNDGGTEFGLFTFRTSDEIAKKLGIAVTRIKLNKQESQQADNLRKQRRTGV